MKFVKPICATLILFVTTGTSDNTDGSSPLEGVPENSCLEKMIPFKEAPLDSFEKKGFEDVPPKSTEGRGVDFYYDEQERLRYMAVEYLGETGRAVFSFSIESSQDYSVLIEFFDYSRPIYAPQGIGDVTLAYENRFVVCGGQLASPLDETYSLREWYRLQDDFDDLYLLGLQYRYK